MSMRSQAPQIRSRQIEPVHLAWFVSTALATLILLSSVPSYLGHFSQLITANSYDSGGLSWQLQLVIGLSELATSFLSIGLAVLLFFLRPKDRMALLASFFFLITAIGASHALDYALTAWFGASSSYQLWSNLQTPAWILLFVVFPDGRFVPRWTRGLFLISIPLTLLSLAGGEWSLLSNVLAFPLFFLTVAAQVYRYSRVSSRAERRQTKWWLYGTFVALLLSVPASALSGRISPPLLNVTPVALTIAIVRSHLWDIDVIIRRTLTYSALTIVLAFIYFGTVVLLQEVLRAFASQTSDFAIVISTLVIAALFAPLRRGIQQVIDQRLYRRKYDAALVLSSFGTTVRDEVDLNRLEGELVRAVQETMQPANISLWLRNRQ